MSDKSPAAKKPPSPRHESGPAKQSGTSKRTAANPRNKGLRFPELHTALGEVLRSCRNRKKVSQSDVGLDADVDRAYISRIERAEQSPTVATLAAIARQLGVPVWQLLKEAEERAAGRSGRGGV
ncbi:MAG: helix-turn-helix domain-containing protein [Bacteroidetes bacterium]|nr:helix-turn-helix domain-containing protein [Bacteroidota bacterium]